MTPANLSYAILANARLDVENTDPARGAFVDLSRDRMETRLLLGPSEARAIQLQGRPGDVTLVIAPACVTLRSSLP